MDTSLLEISPPPRPWMEFPLSSYSSPKRIRSAFVRSRQVGDRNQWACAYSRLDHYHRYHHSLLTKQSIGSVTLESWAQVSSIPLLPQPLMHHPHPQVLPSPTGDEGATWWGAGIQPVFCALIPPFPGLANKPCDTLTSEQQASRAWM